jgi:hypothetical protein
MGYLEVIKKRMLPIFGTILVPIVLFIATLMLQDTGPSISSLLFMAGWILFFGYWIVKAAKEQKAEFDRGGPQRITNQAAIGEWNAGEEQEGVDIFGPDERY